jgi:hypothetical protein
MWTLDILSLDTNFTRRFGIDSEAVVGTRHNLTNGSYRASMNIKFELPPLARRFKGGWTPTFAVEIRGK